MLPKSYVCIWLKLAVSTKLWWETISFKVQYKLFLNDGFCHHKKQQLPLPCNVAVVDPLRLLEVVIFAETKPETTEDKEKLRWLHPAC